MKLITLANIGVAGVTVLAAAGQEAMRLRFGNGDMLDGTLSDLKTESVLWDSRAFPDAQAFKLESVKDVILPSADAINLPEGDHVAVVTLTNGDEVRGSLAHLTEKEVGLLTTFAGELTFRRDMVAKLDIEDRPELIYVGPTGLEGWVQSDKDGWSYDAGTLTCNSGSSIGRDIGQHEKVKIAFDIAWRENARFRLYTHADNKDVDDMENGFELVCQSQYAYMRKRVTRNNRTESMTIGTSGGVREFQEKEKVRIEILHNLASGRVRFKIDERVVADWREPAPDPEKMGSYIHFLADQSNGTSISRIRIATWDGLVDGGWKDAPGGFMQMGRQNEVAEEPEPEEESDIVLRNGDKIVGGVAGIEDGRVQLETSFKNFELPVSRLRSFNLRDAEEAADPELCWEPIRRKGDIRAWFGNGGRITFQLKDIKDSKLVGSSQTFGDATFSMDAFTRLEFNLYPKGYPSRN